MPLSDLRINTTDRIHFADLLAAEFPDFEVGNVSFTAIIIKELCTLVYLTNPGLSEDGNVLLSFFFAP